MKVINKRAAALLVVLVFSTGAFGQTSTATVSGTVQDATGAFIPGVTVTATNTTTNVATPTITNEAGAYNIPALQPGTYTVAAELQVTVRTGAGETSVAGVISDGRANVVQIDDYELHLPPTPGYLLVTQHNDRPGMIGLVGTLLGEADINISSMQVGRRAPRGEALMLLSVDEPIPAPVVERIRQAASLATIKVIKL